MKAQVTIFIIIGLVMLIAVGITLYAASLIAKTPKLVKSNVKSFVEDCLKQSGEKAFFDLGQNAGTLITRPVNNVGCSDHECRFYAEPYAYPWVKFPFIDGEESFVGYFGDSKLPSLDDIKEKLEENIEFNLLSCVNDFGVLKEQGVVVKQLDNPNVSVLLTKFDHISKEKFTTVKLDWSLVESINKQETRFDSFSAQIPVRFSTIYFVLEFIINKDIGDVSYIPEFAGFNVDVNNEFSEFSTITVSDPLSKLFGRDYEFVFTREDRYPALWYLDIPKGFYKGTKLSIKNNELIINDVCRRKEFTFPLKVFDPDEKAVTFDVFPKTLELNNDFIKVVADDGFLQDFQKIPVEVTTCT